jgi:plastocyanin
MHRQPRSLVLTGAVLAALVAAAPAGAMPLAKTLGGTVGPAFTISVSKKTMKAGRFTITIRDRGNIHNFHLRGPGVNKRTGVAATGTVMWTVRLRRGTYTFLCDPHASSMRGTFRVT